jgi:hypothetical protein
LYDQQQPAAPASVRLQSHRLRICRLPRSCASRKDYDRERPRNDRVDRPLDGERPLDPVSEVVQAFVLATGSLLTRTFEEQEAMRAADVFPDAGRVALAGARCPLREGRWVIPFAPPSL